MRFRKIAVGAVDGKVASLVVPFAALGNFFPLCLGASIGDTLKALAIIERRRANAGDTVGDGDVGEAGAIPERRIANAGDAIGDSNAGKAVAFIERIIANPGDAIADGHAG